MYRPSRGESESRGCCCTDAKYRAGLMQLEADSRFQILFTGDERQQPSTASSRRERQGIDVQTSAHERAGRGTDATLITEAGRP